MRNPSSSTSMAGMGKGALTPCCSKVGLKRGPWTPEEDEVLANYIRREGEGRWRTLPKRAGLLRCGKSCRLRWMNYLRPSVKRGQIAPDEEDLILRLHRLLGNRWSLIAGRIPGRTDNEIKNYWNTHLSKKLISQGIDPRTHKPLNPNNPPSDKIHATPSNRPNPNSNSQHSTPNPNPNPNSSILGDMGDNRNTIFDEDCNKYLEGFATIALQSDGGGNSNEEGGMDCCADDIFSSFLNSIINEDIFPQQQQNNNSNNDGLIATSDPPNSSIPAAFGYGAFWDAVVSSSTTFNEDDYAHSADHISKQF